jgi:adenylate cyclase
VSPPDPFGQALAREQTRSLRRVNLIRFIGTLGLVLLYGSDELGLGNRLWGTQFAQIVGYTTFAGIAWTVSEKWPQRARWTALSMPIVDIPYLFMHQVQGMETGVASGSAGFAVGLFALMIVLAAINMDRRIVLGSTAISIVLEVILMSRADVSIGARFAGALVLAMVCAACIFIVGRIRSLVKSTTAAALRRDRLQRYFSPAVAAHLESTDPANLGGQSQIVTVLFSDLRGFTSMSEKLQSAEVVEQLNAYLSVMVDTIFEHGGTLDKFMGDGIMAYFGAPIAQKDHADRAVRCGMEMIEALDTLNQVREAHGLPALKMGVGIHTGEATLGTIGSALRREYTAIGDTVNVASRLESMTKAAGVPMLVSETTKAALADTYCFVRTETAQIRGHQRSYETFVPQALLEPEDLQ